MFYVMGSDGREYGPFTVEQVLQWVAEGRANGYSRTRRDTESTWRPLREFTEFASAAPAAGTAPGAPPPLTPEQIANAYLARNAQVDIGAAVSRGWALVRDNPGPTIGGFLLVFLITMAISFVPLLGFIGMLVIGGPISAGLDYVYIRRLRGEAAGAGDVFDGFSIAFLHLFLVYIVAAVLTSIGFVLCIIPGIYLTVGYVFALPLAIDKRMEFWTAMEVSRRVVHHHWWSVFGYLIVAVLIVFAGLVACLVGMVVAIPVAIAGLMYLYQDLFGEPGRPTA